MRYSWLNALASLPESGLKLNLRHVGVGAGDEAQRHARATGRGRFGRHALQAVQALHALLDHLGDRILDRLRRRTGVGGGDRDAGGRDVGVLLERQLRDGQRAGQHDDDGDDPREDGPVDEES